MVGNITWYFFITVMPLSVPVIFRRISAADLPVLHAFLNNLSLQTRQRFAPHPFDEEGILHFYQSNAGVFSVGGFNADTGEMICYSVLRRGYFEYEFERFTTYGIKPCRETDGMFAPVVADNWQGQGFGRQLFEHTLQFAGAAGFKRLMLWGGVQVNNLKAMLYYRMLGFYHVGFYLHNGMNEEMMMNI